MQQYKQLIEKILNEGTCKAPARAGMPSSTSYFGLQFRYDLSKGFPIVTLKPVSWKGVVTELLWFLRGDTNISYLDKNGVDFMWHQDAYNYYCKKAKEQKEDVITYEGFCDLVKYPENHSMSFLEPKNYEFGDCGYQYGKLWRDFNGVDQIKELISGLINNPEGRRNIITALKPDSYEDMALFTCHNLVQFNCRPLTLKERLSWQTFNHFSNMPDNYSDERKLERLDYLGIPKYYLDCQFYQRSADVILGVPYNTASYALLTHILCKICNMIPGDLIHTFGDAHIYDNHLAAAKEILGRFDYDLPKLQINESFTNTISLFSKNYKIDISGLINFMTPDLFKLIGYVHHSKTISETKLSTGLC